MELERFVKNSRTRTLHQEITDASTSTAGELQLLVHVFNEAQFIVSKARKTGKYC